MQIVLTGLALLIGSAAAGFALNRLVLGRLPPGLPKAIALAASRAVFYAPALVEVGHGVNVPTPLPVAVVYSFVQFGPELDVQTFLLPSLVFAGSLAVTWSRVFGWWFCGLIASHIALFLLLPLAFSSFEARVAWLSVNVLPWYPLHYLDLPVTRFGLLTMPNWVGWLWSLAVWLALYALLAKGLMRLRLQGAMR